MTISRKAKESQAGIWKLPEEQRGKKYYCCTEYVGKHEAKLKQYETELNRIEDKLNNVNKTDKDFYATAGYIVQLAKHSNELFKCSEYEERRLLIKTVLTNVTWNGENLSYDYLEPFNLLAEMNERLVWGRIQKTSKYNNHRSYGFCFIWIFSEQQCHWIGNG